jgi:competence protein ComEA
MDGSSLLGRLRAVHDRLGCTPVEVAALGALVTGALAFLGLLWLRTPPAQPVAETASEEATADVAGDAAFELATGELVVHVAGAVSSPGLYELPVGARVADAVDAAGGATADAVLDQLNLAREVGDGEQLVVPDRDALEAAADGGAGRRADGRVDVNRATAAELEELPGIGPVTARRIVEHRETHGPFAQPSDLLGVSGIGERTFEALADLVGT